MKHRLNLLILDRKGNTRMPINYFKATAYAIGAALIVGGCASSYRPPENAPTATLLFETNKKAQPGPTFVGLWLLDAKNCPKGVEKRALLLDKETNEKPARLSIEAGRQFVFRIEMVNLLGVNVPMQCNVAGAFIPAAGQTYLLDHAINPSGCGFELSTVQFPTPEVRYKQPEKSLRFFGSIGESEVCSAITLIRGQTTDIPRH